MTSKKVFSVSLLFIFFLCFRPALADDVGMVLGGTARIVSSVVQAPFGMLSGGGGPFPFSMVTGLVQGTVRALTGTLSGAASVARGAAPYAKYMVFMG